MFVQYNENQKKYMNGKNGWLTNSWPFDSASTDDRRQLCTKVRKARRAVVSLYDKEEDPEGTNRVPLSMASRTPTSCIPAPPNLSFTFAE